MKVRIQPREIEVPAGDPFRNDLLGRKGPVEILTRLIASIEGPCVLAVDADWGNGKTTFLRIWAQHLRDRGFPVVEFNAWETDFSGEPFVALSTELAESLKAYSEGTVVQKLSDTTKAAKELLRRAVPGIVRIATAGVLDINSLTANEVSALLGSYAEDRLATYREEQKSVKQFKQTLGDMAAALSESQEGRPVVLLIDELDRCRPTYAVEVLEVTKHLFSVDHVVFVLAVNRLELAHSIESLYGDRFDAQGYLRRFFDVDFRLPEVDRIKFIDTMLDGRNLDKHFGEALPRNVVLQNASAAKQEGVLARNLLRVFFSTPDLSLRRIVQAIHHLGLVFATASQNQRGFPIAAVVAVILRTVDRDIYHRFCRGEITDMEVVDLVFGRTEAKPIRGQHEGKVFEAAVIGAAYELNERDSMEWSPSLSPLWQRYAALSNAPDATGGRSDSEIRRASEVIYWVEEFARVYRGNLGFRYSVERLELMADGRVEPGTNQ